MTVEELIQKFKAKFSIPLRYNHAEGGLLLPFCIYNWNYLPLIIADNSVYKTKFALEFNFYTKTKAEATELVELFIEFCAENNIVWDEPDESWDEDESFYLTTFNVEVN